jgi:hypothetical protein
LDFHPIVVGLGSGVFFFFFNNFKLYNSYMLVKIKIYLHMS